MSETQLIKKLVPTVRVSSMDAHKMLTPPGASSRQGTQRPRGGGQPTRHEAQDLQMKAQPMNVSMVGGGAVVVTRPPAPRAARPVTASRAVQTQSPSAELQRLAADNARLQFELGAPNPEALQDRVSDLKEHNAYLERQIAARAVGVTAKTGE